MTEHGPSPSSAAAEIPVDEDIIAGLRDALSAVLDDDARDRSDIEGITRDTPLLSLPLDSLQLVQAMTHVEDRFRVLVSQDAAFTFTTVGELVDHVRDKAVAKAARRGAEAGT